MPTLIVKHRVANFGEWKKVFDAHRGARERHGWMSHLVLQDAADPNLVTIVGRVKSLSLAKEFAATPDLEEAMMRAGVQGPPEVSFLEEAEEQTY
jgi:hypothetical protein